MTKKVRIWLAGATLTGLAALVAIVNASYAGDDFKETRDATLKVAALLKKGDAAGAQKVAAAAAKKIEDMADLMHMFRPRNKGGLGIGPVPLGNNPLKDGIDVKLRDLGRDVPAGIGKEAAALEETGWYIAAMAEMANAKGWGNPMGKKTKKAWKDYSDEMGKVGLEFAKAAKGMGAQEIKSAAAKVVANCNNCHAIFKE